MVIKYTKIFHCKTLQNLTKIGIFGLKTNHLATLPCSVIRNKRKIFNVLPWRHGIMVIASASREYDPGSNPNRKWEIIAMMNVMI
jgi:hypothetical protein